MYGTQEDVEIALEESVKLQSHYAALLNMHDGGQRLQFTTVEEWIDRLIEIGQLKPKSPGIVAKRSRNGERSK